VKTSGTFLVDLLLLAGLAAFAFYFLWTFLAVETAAAAVTLALRMVEKRFT
jgi:hypothetical protein